MSTNGISVLVIDDDAVSREIIMLLLTRQGYLVKTADSGTQALENLRAPGATVPPVVLADLQMPGISGLELAAALRETCGEGLVLIAMSASSPPELETQGYDIFLSKPFSSEQFAEAIRTEHRIDSTDSAMSQDIRVLAPDIYRRLSESMPPDQLHKLYLVCLEDVEKRVRAMQQAAAHGDDLVYRSQAHAIKGGCGMLGALELQTLAGEVENTGLTTNHVATLQEILLASERLKRMLNAHEIAVG